MRAFSLSVCGRYAPEEYPEQYAEGNNILVVNVDLTLTVSSTGSVINGMDDGTLAPQTNATREQIAMMFMRFAEEMAKLTT